MEVLAVPEPAFQASEIFTEFFFRMDEFLRHNQLYITLGCKSKLVNRFYHFVGELEPCAINGSFDGISGHQRGLNHFIQIF